MSLKYCLSSDYHGVIFYCLLNWVFLELFCLPIYDATLYYVFQYEYRNSRDGLKCNYKIVNILKITYQTYMYI